MVELRTDNVKAVVFDWAGTTVDHGCRAPVKVFQAVFDSSGVPISEEEARGPMGLPKRDHLANLLSDSAIRARWRAKVGQDPGNDDVEVLYHRFLEMDRDIVTANSDVIPGVAKTVAALRARGIKIGSTTGYTRAVILACCRFGGHRDKVFHGTGGSRCRRVARSTPGGTGTAAI